MSKEEMREGFEAWHCEQYKTHGMTGAPTRDMHNGVRDENYCSKKSQALWECWQETGGDVAKVEALKEDIERVESGNDPAAWIVQVDGMTLHQKTPSDSPRARNTPLFTRSDAGEVDRLNTVVEQQKSLIADLREELGESVRQVRSLKAVVRISKGWMDNASNPAHNHTKESIVEVCQSVGRLMRDALSAGTEPSKAGPIPAEMAELALKLSKGPSPEEVRRNQAIAMGIKIEPANKERAQ